MATMAVARPLSDGEGAYGHILEDISGDHVTCERLSSALRRGVRSVEVVEGTERRWPQSHSAKLRLTVEESESEGTMELFLKKVVARYLPEQPLDDLRRDLLSNRVEARFYSEFVPILSARGLRLLKAAFVDEQLAALDEHPASAAAEQERVLRQGGVMLLLDCADHRYFQVSPLDEQQLRCTLRALAHLHAAAWEDEALLHAAAERMNKEGGYWKMSQRGSAELESMERHWSAYIAAFQGEAPELLSRPEIIALAARLRHVAPWVAKQVRAGPRDPRATLVHGDFKAMNVFLPREGVEDGDALPIDFQWVGPGLGMSDVAMHLSHSGAVAALRGGGEERLVEYYHGHLCARLDAGAAATYSLEAAARDYALGVLDWARMALGAFFRDASPAAFAARASNPNVGLVYRDAEASFEFVRRVDRCLARVEREMGVAGVAE